MDINLVNAMTIDQLWFQYSLPIIMWCLMLSCWLWGKRTSSEESIEKTIDYLVENNYLDVSYDNDGDMHLNKIKK